METSDLRSARYWESEVPDIRLNPVGSLRRQGLADFVRGEARLRGHILVATSGGNDGPKLAAVSRRAFLSSALQVNAWLRVTGSDRWLCALPDFHVGGLGIFARAFAGGCEAFRFTGRWRNREGEFAGLCEKRAITLTALTPTQVWDLVQADLVAPASVRAVVVGGGRLDPSVGGRARDLGWPVIQSYGMTESASQVATSGLESLEAPFEGEWLPVLPGWETRLTVEGRLEIRGDALFSGYVIRDKDGGWRFEDAVLDGAGWFATSDRGGLRTEGASGRIELRHEGRIDDRVKRLGELISLNELRSRWEGILADGDRTGTLLDVPDDRIGVRLIGLIEGGEDRRLALAASERFGGKVAPFERLDSVGFVERIPRTDLGKVAFRELRAMGIPDFPVAGRG